VLICELRYISPWILKQPVIIISSNVHPKLDYCNSLSKSQINRLQQIQNFQNCLAGTVVKASQPSSELCAGWRLTN